MKNSEQLIIDCHGHIIEPQNLWLQYIDPKFRDRALRFDTTENGVDFMLIDNKPSPYSYGVYAFGGGTGVAYEELCEPGNLGFDDLPLGASEPHARVKYMESEGIDASIIYPSCGLIWGSELKDAELNDAYTRAYNDWAFDFAATNPSRLLALAHLPVLEIERAIAEVKRAAAKGAKGFIMFATPLTKEGFWSPVYDPLWAAIQDTDLPIIFHPALNEQFFGSEWTSGELDGVTDDRYLLFLESCSILVDVMGAVGQLFQGGVLDRFPRLKFVLLETGAGWIPHYLNRSDTKYRRVGSRSPLKRLPSDYFREQFWVGVEPDEQMIPFLSDSIGSDRLLWGTDYPHWDCLPGTLGTIQRKVSGMALADRGNILGCSAIRAFGL